MTPSRRAAAERPDLDGLKAVPLGIVTHQYRQVGEFGGWRRLSAGPAMSVGHLDSEGGTYRAAAAEMTEAERRAAGIRRNGQPRRRG